MISEEDFAAWRNHAVTKEVIRIIEARREALRQSWEGGAFTDYTVEGSMLVNVGNIGTCKGYAFVSELTYEDYLGELDDGESKRAGPPRSSGPDQGV
jgi:hypothetical protein